MPPLYGEGKDVALKRLHMTVKGFSSASGKPKDLEDISLYYVLAYANFKFQKR
jgi:hypothetical protein